MKVNCFPSVESNVGWTSGCHFTAIRGEFRDGKEAHPAL